MPGPNGETCETCYCFDPSSPPDGYDGNCHLQPLVARQPEQTGARLRVVFPPVRKADWCRQWVELKVKPPK